jgi:hypothetical protein
MQASGSGGMPATALASGLAATQLGPALLTRFSIFSKLPTELRHTIWVQVTGGAVNNETPRIIEVKLDQLGFINPRFTMVSPPGRYQAPSLDLRLVSVDANTAWTTRFPNMLRLPGSPRPIYYKASLDIIYLDARSLFVLSEIVRQLSAPGLSAAQVQAQAPIGFPLIQNLATPLIDNDILGMTEELLVRPGGQLQGVNIQENINRAISYVDDCPNALEAEQNVLDYYQRMFNAQQAGNMNAYMRMRGQVRTFFTPNDVFGDDDDSDDFGGEG